MSREQAGLAVEMYGMGVAVGDYNNDGFPDLLVTAVGQNRLFQNTGKAALSMSRRRRAWVGATVSARRRCGLISIATGYWTFLCATM